jgi:ABC-2 type transport system permease protein
VRQGRSAAPGAVGAEVPAGNGSVIAGIVDEVAAPLGAATFAVSVLGVDPGAALARADATAAAGTAGSVTVRTEDVGDGAGREIGPFARTAPQNLVLFTFITGLTAAVLLVKARRTGILRRALASPAPLSVQLVGIALGWFAICLLESLLIVVVGALGFGVHWGEPLAAALLVVLFALVGCGAGLMVGAAGVNEDRVSALTPIAGIVAGALGGCMVPLEVYPPAMRTLARAMPHYWAVERWETLVIDGGGLADIAPNLLVLAAVAVALVAAAAALLRRSLLAMR